jgi:uncharacterized membrane protein
MTERQWVTTGLFGLTVAMLGMAFFHPALWDVKLFEVILQAVVLTGLLNMVTAFHFAANQASQQASTNTANAFAAVREAIASRPPDAGPTGAPGDPVHTVEEQR